MSDMSNNILVGTIQKSQQNILSVDERMVVKTLEYGGERDVYEVMFSTAKGVRNGYFDTARQAADALKKAYKSDCPPLVVWFRTNEIDRNKVSSRITNRFEIPSGATVSADISFIRFTLIDIDAVQPEETDGMPSTDAELKVSLDKLSNILSWLQGYDIKPCWQGISGNGARAVLLTPMERTEENRALRKQFLQILDAKFGGVCEVYLDTQLDKLYGTPVRKGIERLPDRPYRMAKVEFSDNPQQVDKSELQWVVEDNKHLLPTVPDKVYATGEPNSEKQAHSIRAIEFMLERAGIEIIGRKAKQGEQFLYLPFCPICKDETDNGTQMSVSVKTDGNRCYSCFKDKCKKITAGGNAYPFFKKAVQALIPETGLSSEVQAELRKMVKAVPNKVKRERQTILTTNRNPQDIASDAINVLNNANADCAKYFVSEGRLVRISQGKFQSVSDGVLLDILTMEADWLATGAKDSIRYVSPPVDVRSILFSKQDLNLPEIKGTVQHPVFLPSGKLLCKSGYDAESCLWVADSPAVDVPDKPTKHDVEQAKALLFGDLLVDFPFVDDADKANAVGLLLLPFVRQLIDEPTPLHLIAAHTAGTGKSLLARLFSIIATGETESTITEAENDAEWRKLLGARLMDMPEYLLIDNIDKSLDSGTLANVLTTRTFTTRILGKSETVSLPVLLIWIATANNPEASKDIARRIVQINLDAVCEHPSTREGFKHDDIAEWCKENRLRLVSALCVLVRSWFNAGCPTGKATIGSYQRYADVIGGVLEHVGINGFYQNHKSVWDSLNVADNEKAAFIAAWWEKYKRNQVSTVVLLNLAADGEHLEQTLTEHSTKRMGWLVRKWAGTWIGDKVIKKSDKRGAKGWCLLDMSDHSLSV